MDYLEVNFTLSPYEEFIADLLMETLGEIGFESFQLADQQFFAYIQESNFNQKILDDKLSKFEYPVSIDYNILLLENKDWNEEWEKNSFQPILIDNDCVVHSSFHQNVPEAKYDIVINPKMSFGTGHHATTRQVIELMEKIDVQNKKVFDCGSGTGILAIVAAKMGATEVIAVDNDPWCYENHIENNELNQVNTHVQLGGIEDIQDFDFDLILANIQRNYLLEFMPELSKRLAPEGQLIISGFLPQDNKDLLDKALENDLIAQYITESENWSCILLKKK